MFKNLVFLSITALLIIGCGTPEELGTSKVNVTQIPPRSRGIINPIPMTPAITTITLWSMGNLDLSDFRPGSITPTLATHSMTIADDGSFTLTVRSDDSTFTLDGTCGDDGVILMNVPGVSATYSSEDGGSTLSTTNVDGVTVPDDIQVGDDWSQTISVVGSSGSEVTLAATIETTYKALGYETVTVPAGTFYALKIEENGSLSMGGENTFDTHRSIWYAEDVGTVKSGSDRNIYQRPGFLQHPLISEAFYEKGDCHETYC